MTSSVAHKHWSLSHHYSIGIELPNTVQARSLRPAMNTSIIILYRYNYNNIYIYAAWASIIIYIYYPPDIAIYYYIDIHMNITLINSVNNRAINNNRNITAH